MSCGGKILYKRLILIAVISVLFVYFYQSRKLNLNNVKLLSLKRIKENGTKFILYWSPFWSTWDHLLGYGFEPFKKCEFSNCFATNNRSLMPLEEYDALLFHAAYSKKRHGVPWIRAPHQIFIFSNVEAPVYICPDLKQYHAYFNWTMSYRYDSDVVRRHGYVLQEKTNYSMPSGSFLKNKTRLAAWMVSNCQTRSHREVLVNELRNFMLVDVYGYCGTLQCPRKKGNGKISSPECYNILEEKYKFYFSFENSYCKDYSTEKLYNILQKDIVPVVYGFGDYKFSAPTNSVINVEDFESAGKLADYLKYLADHDEEYLKYFEWKKDYKISTLLRNCSCQMCKKLHEPIKQSIYYDLHEWWWGKNKSNCKTNKALPKIVSDLLL